MADLMVLGADGTVRTSGWSYHNRQDLGADWVPNSGVDSAPAAILTAIRATSDRHAGNRGPRTVGLSSRGWHILFQALVEAESDYDPGATSRKGAYGLGQLMPETALALGVDRRDVAQNLDGAARYLLAQIADFRNIDLALAAYNAGPHRVREFDGVPPFSETRAYIARIHHIQSRLSGQPAPPPVIRVASRPAEWTPVVIDLNPGGSNFIPHKTNKNLRLTDAQQP